MAFMLLRSYPGVSSFQVSWSDLMTMDVATFIAMYHDQHDLLIKREADSVGD